MTGKYTVRLYDGFDNIWMDVSESVSLEEAQRIYNKMTNNGKCNTKYDDIDCYEIFPSDTIMAFSEKGIFPDG